MKLQRPPDCYFGIDTIIRFVIGSIGCSSWIRFLRDRARECSALMYVGRRQRKPLTVA